MGLTGDGTPVMEFLGIFGECFWDSGFPALVGLATVQRSLGLPNAGRISEFAAKALYPQGLMDSGHPDLAQVRRRLLVTVIRD